jgi:hypothetical protein
MMLSAYEFAKNVELQIEALARDEHLRHSGIGKLLLEEWYPIGRLGLHLKQPGLQVDVEAFGDSGVADGHIVESGFRDREFDVQVTYMYSYDEELRRELMVKQGYSPGAGPISRDKKSGDVVATGASVDLDHNITQTACAIAVLFGKKAAKLYPSDTALIIAFDDMTLRGWVMWETLLALATSKVNFNDSKFQSVFILNCATNELIQVI